MKQATDITFSIDYQITRAKLEEIQHVRYRIYSDEMQLPLPSLDHQRKLLTDTIDRPATHICARQQTALIGAVRLNRNAIPADLEAPLEAALLPRPFVYCARMFVLPEWRGGSVTRRLTRACFLEFSRERAAVAVCHCYPPLLPFYQRIGFYAYGTPFLLPGLEALGVQTPMRCESRVWQVPQAA